MSEKPNPRVSVVMITMNEQGSVGKVIQDIQKAYPVSEILLVDSSKDQTPQIAESLGAKVVRQFPPQGYGPAMDRALRSASGDIVITLDCDDTYPAEDIPRFVRYIAEEGYDVVDGSRLEHKSPHMPALNYLANYAFGIFASTLFFRRITDLHSGMRAYRRSVIEELKYDCKGAALPVELLLRPLKDGRKVKFIFIDYRMRIGESTMRPLESAWWTLKRILGVRLTA
ncbi:glycosyltransferase family 2 protein [bacterium]|nr:glycosyltransferase family 2 protein [bacterium]